TVAVAESCTGGLLAAALTSVPGSSATFKGGLVANADDVKRGGLGVSAAVLRRHGAVSRECAEAMARGVRAGMASEVAVAVTGIAGPDGGVPGKPVGTVWFAVAAGARVISKVHRFTGSRAQVRRQAVQEALRLLAERVAA